MGTDEINLEDIYEAWKKKYPQENITANNDAMMHLELGLAKKFEMRQEQIECMLEVVTPGDCQIRSLDLIRLAILLQLDMNLIKGLQKLKDSPMEILRSIKFELRKEAMQYMEKQMEAIEKEKIPKIELEKAREEFVKKYEAIINEKNRKIEILEMELRKEKKAAQQEEGKWPWRVKKLCKTRNHLKELAELFGSHEFDDKQASELIAAYESGVPMADIKVIAKTEIPADKMHMLWQLVKR